MSSFQTYVGMLFQSLSSVVNHMGNCCISQLDVNFVFTVCKNNNMHYLSMFSNRLGWKMPVLIPFLMSSTFPVKLGVPNLCGSRVCCEQYKKCTVHIQCKFKIGKCVELQSHACCKWHEIPYMHVKAIFQYLWGNKPTHMLVQSA